MSWPLYRLERAITKNKNVQKLSYICLTHIHNMQYCMLEHVGRNRQQISTLDISILTWQPGNIETSYIRSACGRAKRIVPKWKTYLFTILARLLM